MSGKDNIQQKPITRGRRLRATQNAKIANDNSKQNILTIERKNLENSQVGGDINTEMGNLNQIDKELTKDTKVLWKRDSQEKNVIKRGRLLCDKMEE
ncbi:hypothetical protein ANTPLA_LOCUS10504 [Anthophora plagiata]